MLYICILGKYYKFESEFAWFMFEWLNAHFADETPLLGNSIGDPLDWL